MHQESMSFTNKYDVICINENIKNLHLYPVQNYNFIKMSTTATDHNNTNSKIPHAQNNTSQPMDCNITTSARKSFDSPTTKAVSRGPFKKSHTCGSLFAKCSCYNETSEGRTPLLQTFSHPTSESYSNLRKISNARNTCQTTQIKPTPKRLSNPEISHSKEIDLHKVTGGSKSIQNLSYLCHPEIPYPVPIYKKNSIRSDVNHFHSQSVPKHFESKLNWSEQAQYISDYSGNFYHTTNSFQHPDSNIKYNNQTTSLVGRLEQPDDPAQKYFKESGIFGPMGNGVTTIRRNSSLSNDAANDPIGQIRKISKTMCIDNKRKNSGVPEDYEYLKGIVTQLKKELSDNEIKVGNLEKKLLSTKKQLRVKESEILKLHREIHKLKSVLQQATSLYKDSDILASLQEQHGMATKTLQQSLSVSSCSKKQGVSAESSEFTGQACDIQITRYEKDFRSKQLIKDAIMDNDFLKNLDSSQVREIVDTVYSKEFEKGSYVIREGEAGAHLFVSAEGEYEIIKDGKVLGKMGPGKAFGELAILYNCTRTASIQAVSDCRVWVLDRKVFQQIMMRTGLQRLQDNINFLRSVPLLQHLNNDVLAKIADVLEVEFYPAGAYIIRQGASGDTFFIISSGSVKVTQRVSGRLEEEDIRTLSRGDYFGEQALLKEDFRTASIIALHPGVECLTLDRDSFIQLIGDLSELQEKDYGDEQRVLTRPNSSVSVCLDAQAEYEFIRLDDLEVIATLGIGGFGRVELVQYAYDHTLTFALKCLKKQHIVETQQQEHVFSEKNIMLSCRSPFICRMYRTFRDSKYVYMLLEACLGGEVWTILRDRGCFDDHTTRFITSCVIEAFSYLHTRGIIYRDLKPENLLLDSQGYVKLVDFGFSKRLGYSSKTWTFCGTPEYVSPETILNKGHDRAVDYWGLGILMHELLTGSPPFTASDPMKTYNLILKGIDMVDFPRHITRAAQSLIKRLCRDLPSERLGYQRGGIQDIKKHKWFQGFDWDGLKARTLPAPIIQPVRSPQDTSNFDCYNKDSDIPPDEFSGWDMEF